jgi:hypothetical protein
MIDRSKLGPIVGVGGEHIVREYGDSKVIKVPAGLRFILNPKRFKEWVPRDYRVAKRYFGQHVLEAKIILGKHRYWIIQRKIPCQPLTIHQLRKNLQLRRQFCQILKNNHRLIKDENLSWDFYGAMGLFKSSGTLTNLVICDNRLMMIDFGMLYLERDDQNWLIYLITRWAYHRQNYFLHKVQRQLKL